MILATTINKSATKDRGAGEGGKVADGFLDVSDGALLVERAVEALSCVVAES